MNIEIQLFAVLKEALGERVTLDVPEPVTVEHLLERFVNQYPQFRNAVKSLNVAVDQSYARGEETILPGQEVAIFPPVSGG